MSGRAQGNSACAKFALGRVAPPDRPLAWLGMQGGAWNGDGGEESCEERVPDQV